MRSEALDIVIEGHDNTVWLKLSGPFHREQVPSIREKIMVMIDDGNRQFVIDLEGITAVDDTVAPMFLSLLNALRGKGGELKLIFKNDLLRKSFALYSNLFQIYPDALAISSGGAFSSLKRRVLMLSRKTGVRISRPVAILLLFMLCGWFLSLGYIIRFQSQRMKEQEKELNDLAHWKHKSLLEIQQLKERLRPMEQLGILRDTVPE